MILDHEVTLSYDTHSHPPYAPPPYEDDDEYDVYLFWPSSSPQELVPTQFDGEDFVELPPAYTDAPAFSEDGIPDAPSFIHPLSPTYSFLSDFVFPEVEHDDMEAAGYSRLFRSGLACTSRQITRQLDNVYRQLQRALHLSWWRRSS